MHDGEGVGVFCADALPYMIGKEDVDIGKAIEKAVRRESLLIAQHNVSVVGRGVSLDVAAKVIISNLSGRLDTWTEADRSYFYIVHDTCLHSFLRTLRAAEGNRGCLLPESKDLLIEVIKYLQDLVEPNRAAGKLAVNDVA